MRVDWSQFDGLLGTLTDQAVAHRIGCSVPAVGSRRRQLGIPALDPRPDWTHADDLRLISLWGQVGVAKIAKALGRTPGAVRFRVQRLGLGPWRRGRMALHQASQYSGWDVTALRRACRALRIAPVRHPVTDVRQERRTASYLLLDEEQVDRICEWLDAHGGRREGYASTSILGPDGAAPACRECARTDLPHAGLGLCPACYRRDRRRRGLVQRRGDAAWTGRQCVCCGSAWDVPVDRRRGAPPRFCDACRATGHGERLRDAA